jgi:hypothetical protein
LVVVALAQVARCKALLVQTLFFQLSLLLVVVGQAQAEALLQAQTE